MICKLCMVLYNILWKKTVQPKIENMGAISMTTLNKNIIVGFEDIKVKLLPFSYPSIKPISRANSWPCISRRIQPPRRLLRQAR